MNLKNLIAVAALSAPSLALAANYEIDSAHSAAQFSVRHMMVSNVRGQFSKVSGTAVLDDKDPKKSMIDATIDASTIDTREPKRDAHLKSPDFFDVEKFPTITFKSTDVKKTGKGKYTAKGDLTMHGVTKPVVLAIESAETELKDPWGNVKRGAVATTKVNRKDFGLNWNQALEAGGVLVGDEVQVTLDIELAHKEGTTASNK
jgi:polyisoprenoid-binding protein YceI